MKPPTKTISQVRREIAIQREKLLNGKMTPWRTVAKENWPNVPPATLCAIYKHEREPQKSWIRESLGLPGWITIKAKPCPHCGEARVVKHCPCRHKPRAPRLRYVDYPVWTLSDLADLARVQPDARVVVLGVGADYDNVRVGWER